MRNERLQEIEARANVATEDPWEQNGWVVNASYGIGDVIADAGLSPADARFIASARSDVPDLIAEIRRLKRVLEPTDDTVEQLAAVTRPALFGARGDDEVGPATRWERNDTRERVRAVLAELERMAEES